MKKDSDELINKVLNNLDEDRTRLTDLYKKMLEVTELDLISAVGISEQMTKVVEAMTKQNVQIIELVKLKSKMPVISQDESNDSDDIYEAINKADEYQ